MSYNPDEKQAYVFKASKLSAGSYYPDLQALVQTYYLGGSSDVYFVHVYDDGRWTVSRGISDEIARGQEDIPLQAVSAAEMALYTHLAKLEQSAA